ncbi:MAG: diguanylate cyclase [Candidatus Riflebacteria bacterium]|nr:diguanylate cyclase [Candidatus Riflebacteria bacterium]
MPARTVVAYVLGLLVAGLVLAVTRAGYFEAVESRFVDWKSRHRPQEEALDTNVALIEVTDGCLRRSGALPWRRSQWARLIDAARLGGAKVIGVDVLFDETAKDPAEDDALIRAVRAAGNVILAAEVRTKVELDPETTDLRKEVYVRRPHEALGRVARGVGIVNIDFIYDNVDGILRVMPLAQRVAGNLVPTLALATAAEFQDVKPTFLPGGGLSVGTYTVPQARARLKGDIDRMEGENILRTAAEASAYVNYSALTSRGVFTVLSASDVFEVLAGLARAQARPASDPGRPDDLARWMRVLEVFRGKVVLMGVNVTGVDMKTVPFGPMAGVEVQANVIRNVLDRGFLVRLPSGWLAALLIILGLAAPLLFLRWGLLVGAVATVGFSAALAGSSISLFNRHGVLVDVLPPILLANGQFVTMKLFLLALDLRRRIRSLEQLTLYSRRFNSTLDLEDLRRLIQDSYLAQTGAEASILVLPADLPDELEVFPGTRPVPPGTAEWALGAELRGALFARWASRPAPIALDELGGPSGPEGYSEGDIVLLPLLHREAAVGFIAVFGPDLESSVTSVEDRSFWTTLASIAYTALQNARHYKLATVDGLTGLQVRHIFDLEIEKEFGRASRYGGKLSLLLTDIDHFKSFNDTYGHQLGDRVLRHVADQVKRSIRLSDTAARYGGEEFTVILPETDFEGGKLLAERIRTRIEELRVPHDGKELQVTISIGLASMGLTKARNAKAFITEADTALYAAKQRGRNQVRSFGDPKDGPMGAKPDGKPGM